MKKSLYYSFLAILSLIFFESCETDDKEATLPQVATTAASGIGEFTAQSGGTISSDGNAPILARGVCWSATELPTIENDKTEDGTGKGSFTSSLTGLESNTTYLVRAYAVNKVGVAYGEQLEFTTDPTLTAPTVTTASITDITSTSAVSGGNVTDDGHTAITARGVCWSTTQNPTTADSKTTDGTGTGEFVSNLTSLAPGTMYYVRAYATNAVGTSYGNELSFSSNSITTTIYAAKDASIFDTQAGGSANSNYGAGGSQLLQVGYASPTLMYARTLVQFDLSSIPSNAVIENVSLIFTQGSSGGATGYTIYFHKLTQQWTEGTTSFCTYNNSCNTQGVAIAMGGTDVTWNEISYSGSNANPWTTLGGSFSSTESASKLAGSTTVGTPYEIIADGLKADVQAWVSNSATNFGWLLKTDFITSTMSMKRFYSREGATASGDATTAPKLVITYH